MKDPRPKCRLKITLACDRACEYCINKDKAYRGRWQKIDNVEKIPWKNYRTFIISGGEPTLDVGLESTLRTIRIYTDGLVPVYLQTNGRRLTKALVRRLDENIDGIGLSIHDLDEFRHMLTRWGDIATIKPIRLYVQDTISAAAGSFVHGAGLSDRFSWNVWHAGCADHTEDIYLLDGWKDRKLE